MANAAGAAGDCGAIAESARVCPLFLFFPPNLKQLNNLLAPFTGIIFLHKGLWFIELVSQFTVGRLPHANAGSRVDSLP